MDRKEFLEKVASKTGIELKEVEQVFQKFLELTTTALRDGEKVSLAGFGTFSPKITKAVKKFSAILNREIEIPEKFTVSFSSASKIADEINIKYKDEKPKIIKEASEREIEKKVSIMPPEQEEEFSKTEKLLEKISELEGTENQKSTGTETEEEVSLSAELLEALKETTSSSGEPETEVKEKVSEIPKKEEEKEEVSKMPEMNLNQEKPKFTYGEDLSTPSTLGSGTYQQSFPSSSTTDAPGYREKESSSTLWITLIILLIGIIGIGIYWALSSDITETKKEPVVTLQKETTPPVVVEKKPKVGKREIIIAPEEYATIPSDTALKQQTPLVVEEPRKEKPSIEKKESISPVQKEPQVTKVEEKSLEPMVTSPTPVKRKPISRGVTTKSQTISKTPLATTQGEYSIQVNSYAEKRFADAFAKDLRNKGYRAFVESADHPNLGRVYRVKVGFYMDEDAAAKDYHSLRLLLKKEDIYIDRR